MKLRYTDQARDDLEIAFTWYEVETILQMPKLYAKHHADFRRVLVRRFPFSIFYTLEQDEIIVHAVLDNRQHPARLP